MTYVVTEDCIGCKFTTCVQACPVDCFREGDLMLVIDPTECIDCGVCAPECEAKAILPDTDPEAAVGSRSTRVLPRTGQPSPRPRTLFQRLSNF